MTRATKTANRPDHGTSQCPSRPFGIGYEAPRAFRQLPRTSREVAATKVEFDGIVASITEICDEVSGREAELEQLVAEQRADMASDDGTGIYPTIDEQGRRIWLQDEIARRDFDYDDGFEDDEVDHTFLSPENIGLAAKRRCRGYSPAVDFDPSDEPTDPHPLDGFLIRGR